MKQILNLEVQESKLLTLDRDNGWKMEVFTIYGKRTIPSIERIIQELNNLVDMDDQGLDDTIHSDIKIIKKLVDTYGYYSDMVSEIQGKFDEIKESTGVGTRVIIGETYLLMYLLDDYQLYDCSTFSNLLDMLMEDLNITTSSHNRCWTECIMHDQFGIFNYPFNPHYEVYNELDNKFKLSAIDEILSLLKLIPDCGKSSTRLGEVFRAHRKVLYRYVNDGDSGEIYNEASFTAACNSIDFLHRDRLDSETIKVIESHHIKAYDQVYPPSNPNRFRPEDRIVIREYVDNTWESTCITIMGWYDYMVEELINCTDDIREALRNKDLKYLQSNLKQGVNLSFNVDKYPFLLTSNNDLDFIARLYYFPE